MLQILAFRKTGIMIYKFNHTTIKDHRSSIMAFNVMYTSSSIRRELI